MTVRLRQSSRAIPIKLGVSAMHFGPQKLVPTLRLTITVQLIAGRLTRPLTICGMSTRYSQ